MVAEQNNDSDVTDLKLDLDGDIFPSIITVSPISKKNPVFKENSRARVVEDSETSCVLMLLFW